MTEQTITKENINLDLIATMLVEKIKSQGSIKQTILINLVEFIDQQLNNGGFYREQLNNGGFYREQLNNGGFYREQLWEKDELKFSFQHEINSTNIDINKPINFYIDETDQKLQKTILKQITQLTQERLLKDKNYFKTITLNEINKDNILNIIEDLYKNSDNELEEPILVLSRRNSAYLKQALGTKNIDKFMDIDIKVDEFLSDDLICLTGKGNLVSFLKTSYYMQTISLYENEKFELFTSVFYTKEKNIMIKFDYDLDVNFADHSVMFVAVVEK